MNGYCIWKEASSLLPLMMGITHIHLGVTPDLLLWHVTFRPACKLIFEFLLDKRESKENLTESIQGGLSQNQHLLATSGLGTLLVLRPKWRLQKASFDWLEDLLVWENDSPARPGDIPFLGRY